MGEWHDAGDVADPPEALGGPARSVDVNGAASVDFGAGRVGVERFGSGVSPGLGAKERSDLMASGCRTFSSV